MSARTIYGCAIKVKTDCKSAKLKGANLSKANLKGAVRVPKKAYKYGPTRYECVLALMD